MATLNRADSNVRLGNQSVGAVYAGAVKVWPNTNNAYYDGLSTSFAHTPDAPEFRVTNDVRITSRIRVNAIPTGPAQIVSHRQAGAIDISFDSQVGSTGSIHHRFSTTGTGLQLSEAFVPPIVLGEDLMIGAQLRIVDGNNASVTGLSSIDGITWAERHKQLSGAGAIPFVGFDSSQLIRIGTIGGTFLPFDGRIYWSQMEAVNRARLVYPNSQGNHLSVPLAQTSLPGNIEICVRMAQNWPVDTGVALSGLLYLGGSLMLRRPSQTGKSMQAYWNVAPDNANGSSTCPFLSAVPADALFWLRFRLDISTGIATWFWAPDSETEPTSGWVSMTPSAGTATPGQLRAFTPNTLIGRVDAAARWWVGHVPRVIVKDGFDGIPVLDVDETRARADATTFYANTGQLVTQIGNSVITPIPDRLLFRFDADDWARGNTWVGTADKRTWTLSNGASIVPSS